MDHSEIIGNGIVLCKNAITITEASREYIDECEQKSESPYNSQKTGIGFEFRSNNSKSGVTPSRFGVDSHSPIVKAWNGAIYKSIIKYCQYYPEIMPSLWWGIRGHLLSYQNNQHIGWHADNNIPNYLPANYGSIPKNQFPLHCSLSVLLYLNTSVECAHKTDEYEGGQLHFKYQNVSYTPTKGDIILYPSNFMGAHSVSRVQKGIRRAYLKFYGHGMPSSTLSLEELEWLPSLRNDVNYENKFLEQKKKNNNIVYWAYDHQKLKTFPGLGLCMFEPVPVLSHYYKNKEMSILYCPAFRAALQHTYAILSPIDIRIRYSRSDRLNKKMEVEFPPRLSPEAQQTLLVPRFGHTGDRGNEMFSIFFIPYLFYCDHSMVMETLPPFLEWNNRNNARVICGSFDIGKWKRVIEYAVELKDADGVFEIKRGEPLLYVRFNPASPLEQIYLKPTTLTPELRDEMSVNVNLKRVLPKQTLQACYALRKKYNDLFK